MRRILINGIVARWFHCATRGRCECCHSCTNASCDLIVLSIQEVPETPNFTWRLQSVATSPGPKSPMKASQA
jgi:hypothetical protein